MCLGMVGVELDELGLEVGLHALNEQSTCIDRQRFNIGKWSCSCIEPKAVLLKAVGHKVSLSVFGVLLDILEHCMRLDGVVGALGEEDLAFNCWYSEEEG